MLSSLIEMVARIRAFELHLLKLFGQGQLSGTTHTCVGQELCAAVLSPLLDPQRDYVFSNHRCHGHFMAFGGSMPDLLSEIMGREGGVCGGRGGSQHLCSGNFFSNGLQGGNLPIATGVALARRLTDGERTVPGGIVVCFIGDGTLGEGIVYETMNLASLWSLPLLVVVEHNGYAQSTDTRTTTSGDVAQRFAAFGIATDRRSPECLEVLCEHLRQVVAGVRGTDGRPVRPFVQILDTFRLAAHSKGDDHRPPEVIQAAWRGDWFNRLLEKGDAAATEAWRRAEVEVDEVEKEVTSRPMMAMERIEAYAPIEVPLFGSSVELVAGSGVDLTLRINECLNRGLGELMERRDDVILLGEDLADPYGGAFKVTKGLSARFPHRVLNTPISEAAITGVSTGLALAGMRPVVEIMFGDFVTLAMDQLINHASKLFFMSNERVKVPLVLRLVSGGYRGYGATHSQSLEARLCGVPGLKVVALSRRHDPVRLLAATIEHDENPVILVENKVLYGKRPLRKPPTGCVFVPSVGVTNGSYPALHFMSETGRSHVTVATYGGLTDVVEEAMERLLLEMEIEFDYFVVTQLYPLELGDVLESVARTKRFVFVEEGVKSFGVGAEVVATLLEADRQFCCRRVGAADVPIPCARQLEQQVLPSAQRVLEAIVDVLNDG